MAFYSIGEVAERCGINPVTLRAWQRRYGLLKPQRSEGGHRQFDEEDIPVSYTHLDVYKRQMVHRRGVRTNFSTSAVNVCMPFVPPSGGNSADDASIMGGCLIIFRVLLS